MRIPRIFQPIFLESNRSYELDENASHHLARVLRKTVGDDLILFAGNGAQFSAKISRIEKNSITVTTLEKIEKEVESPLQIHLAQGISRGEKMDYTIQKAVELGVRKIIPLFTKFCEVRLDHDRSEKRKSHWQSIIINACEQSGRTLIPELSLPQQLDTWVQTATTDLRLVLAPEAKNHLKNISMTSLHSVTLLIGPEGGLSETEVALAEQHGFFGLNLGPRILRTETAALAAIAALQCLFGDLG